MEADREMSMKMWKIAIASMVLASSAFGAVAVTMDQTGYDAGTNVATFDMKAVVTSPSTLQGFSIYSDETQPKMNQVWWVGRTTAAENVGKLDQWQAADPPAGGQLMSDTFIDFGAGRKLATQDFPPAIYTLGTWSFKVADPTELPISVVLYAGTYIGSGDGVMADTSFVITPEPASMMLLAAGAAFFARRRRA